MIGWTRDISIQGEGALPTAYLLHVQLSTLTLSLTVGKEENKKFNFQNNFLKIGLTTAQASPCLEISLDGPKLLRKFHLEINWAQIN